VLHGAPVLPEDSVQDAILRHGFSAAQEQFDNWKDAIVFLNQQAVAARRSLGKEIPDAISGKDILNVAPSEVLSSFLDRVEREIIPQRLFDNAEDFLLAFLASRALGHQPELGARAAALLQRNKEARKKSEAGISELANRDIRFPSLEQKQGDFALSVRLTKLIRERGCVFATGF
jgi:hypothetical protein